MDVLTSIFRCELSIGSYKFKESIFAIWEVIHVLKSWNLWYIRVKTNGDSGKSSPNLEKTSDSKETTTQKSFKILERKSPFKKKEYVFLEKEYSFLQLLELFNFKWITYIIEWNVTKINFKGCILFQ